jgi:hypothetical protein
LLGAEAQLLDREVALRVSFGHDRVAGRQAEAEQRGGCSTREDFHRETPLCHWKASQPAWGLVQRRWRNQRGPLHSRCRRRPS